MKGKIELYNISFLILKVELHFKEMFAWFFPLHIISSPLGYHLVVVERLVCL